MGNWARQFDMTHSLPSDFRQGHFHAALFADYPAMLEPLVLAAQTLVILVGTENLGTEQAVSFGFEGPIVDCLGFFDLAI